MGSIKTEPIKASKSTLDKIEEGMKLVTANLIAYKKAKNSEIVVMQDGKIVYLKPDEIPD